MPFHRLTTPSYFGGLPGTHDEINNTTSGTPAPADVQSVDATYSGTYFIVPGEFATANNANRPAQALAENTDFIDDILYTSQPVPAFAQDTGAGQTNVQIISDVFVGKSGTADTQDNRDLLAAVIDNSGNEIVDSSGTRVVVSEIRDSGNAANVIGTEASGYHSSPFIHFNVPMPAGVVFRIVFFLRGTYTALADASGSGQMGDLAGRLLTNIGRQRAWTTPFEPSLSSWADSSDLVSTTTQEAVDEIVSDLSASSGSDLIGAAVYSGVGTALSAGSVQSQLRELSDELGGLAASNTWTALNTFQAGLTFSSLTPFTITKAASLDLLFEILGGGSVEWDLANNNFFIDLETDNTRFALRDSTDLDVFAVNRAPSSVISVTLGTAAGVTDAYTDTRHQIVTRSSTTTEARGLLIGPGSSNGADGTFLSLRAAGGNGGSAGGIPGHIQFDMNTQEGVAQYRTLVPTQSYALRDGGPAQILNSVGGGTNSFGPKPPDSTFVTLEAHVFGHGWSAGAPDGKGATYIIRGIGQSDSVGTYSIIGTPTVDESFSTLDDNGATLDVDIVADTNGFFIQVTPPTGLSTQNSLWWGYLIISAFTFTDIPDNNFI